MLASLFISGLLSAPLACGLLVCPPASPQPPPQRPCALSRPGDGKVTKMEFRKAMAELGLEVPVEEVDGLFDSFDPDGGGSIEYAELSVVLRNQKPGAAGKKGAALASTVAIDPDGNVQEQLRDILVKNAVRVIGEPSRPPSIRRSPPPPVPTHAPREACHGRPSAPPLRPPRRERSPPRWTRHRPVPRLGRERRRQGHQEGVPEGDGDAGSRGAQEGRRRPLRHIRPGWRRLDRVPGAQQGAQAESRHRPIAAGARLTSTPTPSPGLPLPPPSSDPPTRLRRPHQFRTCAFSPVHPLFAPFLS